jgi:hypothetical protein
VSERIFRCRNLGQARSVFVMAWNASKSFDKPFEIVLRFLKDKRTIEQNRRMWKLLREVAATVWVDVDGKQRQFADKVWHLYFREQFIGVEETEMPDGSVKRDPISTTTLDVEGMTEYMNKIEQWCLEQGYPVMEQV